MRVQFTYSQEEILDALLRFNARSKMLSRMRRTWNICTGLIAGLFILFIFGFSLKGLIAGAAAALIAVIIGPWIYRYEQRKNMRKLIKEHYGVEQAFICQVELVPHALKTSTANVEGTFPWEDVEEIVETNDSVDIFTRKGFCIVRDRAFNSVNEKQKFISLAREYMNQAQGAQPLQNHE